MKKLNAFREPHAQNRIVLAAKRLFHQHGVHATPIDAIIRAAEVAPKEFHRSFRTKQKLTQEVVRAYLEEIESGTSPLHPKLASWRDFKRSLAVHMKFLKEFNMLRGCPLAIIGNELTEEDDTVRQVLSLVFDALTKRIAALFLKLKTEGRLPRNANERQLAEFCVAVMQGSMVVGKVRGKSEAVAQIFKEMVSHFEEFRLSPRN